MYYDLLEVLFASTSVGRVIFFFLVEGVLLLMYGQPSYFPNLRSSEKYYISNLYARRKLF